MKKLLFLLIVLVFCNDLDAGIALSKYTNKPAYTTEGSLTLYSDGVGNGDWYKISPDGSHNTADKIPLKKCVECKDGVEMGKQVYILTGNPTNVVKSYRRDGVINDVNLLEGNLNPSGNSGKGLNHILERHSEDFYVTHSKGDLFPKGTTIDQIVDGIKEVYSKGTRQSALDKPVQIFEKRISINGQSANYRLAVDAKDNIVITFFKIGN